MADIAQKWTCEKCTYENFPASSKCVICGHPGPFLSSSGVDIYNLACQSSAKISGITGSLHQPRNTKEVIAPHDQWTCSECTLLNGVWLDVCAACNARRDVLLSNTPSNQTVKSNSSSSPPCRSNRSSSNYNTVTAPRLAVYLPKWRCCNCTYDNYPKSQKSVFVIC